MLWPRAVCQPHVFLWKLIFILKICAHLLCTRSVVGSNSSHPKRSDTPKRCLLRLSSRHPAHPPLWEQHTLPTDIILENIKHWITPLVPGQCICMQRTEHWNFHKFKFLFLQHTPILVFYFNQIWKFLFFNFIRLKNILPHYIKAFLMFYFQCSSV